MEGHFQTVNAEYVDLYFGSEDAHSLSFLLTLKPQLTVLIRLLCLKSTFSVFTLSPILTNCTVVVAFHLHAVLNYLKCPNGTFFLKHAEGYDDLSHIMLPRTSVISLFDPHVT